MSNSTATLIQLRRHYENIIAQSEYQSAKASEQLQHIDALLVNGLVHAQELPALDMEVPALDLPALTSATAPSPSPTSLSPTVEDGSESEASCWDASSDRTPRTLLPAYTGLKRLDAIAQALQTTPGQDMSTDSLIRELFGNLTSADQKSERKRLNTLLYKGEKLGLWKKGKAPSSYRIGKAASKSTPPTAATPEPDSPTPSTPAQTPTKSASKPPTRAGQLPLLPEFDGMNKLEAISKVLSDQAGHVLHQDSIIQLLYGDLTPEVLKEETRRLRASLFQGVTKGLWQKAPKQPSSYLVKAAKARKAKSTEVSESADLEASVAPADTKVTSAAKPGRKPGRPKADKPKTGNAPVSKPKQASRGREQVLSLPAEFEGLSKIDAVSKVLSEEPGTVMHIEDIIERFYGELSKADLKAEKDRMKDVMTRGVKRGLWRKASGVPSSFVVKTR